MKAFQAYFNPKQEKGHFLEIFCYNPNNKQEEILGNLYLIAQLKDSRTNDKHLLRELIDNIKDQYYADPNKGIEESFKQALGRMRFEQLPITGLSLVIFCIGPNLATLFSKIGQIKVFVFRGQEVFNLGDNPSFNSTGQKMFSNIMQGFLEPGDKIAVLNQELFKDFWEKMIFQKIKEIKKPKDLQKFFKEQKETLKHFFGILLFVFVKRQGKRIYLKAPKIPLPSQVPKKVLAAYPVPSSIFRKTIISIIFLIILLLLGWVIF